MKRRLLFLTVILALLMGLVAFHTPVKADNNTATLTVKVIAARLRIRSLAGTQGKLVGVLKRNDVVVLLGKNAAGTWLKITANGLTGWVSVVWIKLGKISLKSIPVVS